MPELPEVETIRGQLQKTVVGMQIIDVTFPDRASKVLKGKLENVVGTKIIGIRRFGKLLILDLSDHFSLAIHLKMTGQLILLDAGKPLLEYTHVVFTLKGVINHALTQKLTFSDMRLFGFVEILPTEKVLSLPFIKKLGPEPLKDLTLKEFEKICASTRRQIKTLFLDQHKIAGIGNIYACESLWMAGVSPQRTAHSLQRQEIKALFTATESVLREGIARGGASDNSYLDLFGQKGNYQKFFKVYGQTKKPCQRCSTPITRISLAGRGTFFCPECQKE